MDHTEKIDVLVEALPYVNRFHGHIVVVKYGGNAMINEDLKKAVLSDVLLMKSVGMLPVVVHGGGPFITQMLDRLNMESEFINGIRVTNRETMKVVEMVLAGSVNNDILKIFNHIGGSGVGLSGMDDQLLTVKKMDNNGVDYGYVGEVTDVNTDLIHSMLEEGKVPIISSIGMGSDGKSYNINADTVASAIASHLLADKLMLLTDVEGVLLDSKDSDSIISCLSEQKAESLIQDGTIYGGMIPKVQCCIDAVKSGVGAAHIIDGRLKHSILLELFFDMGIGTMLMKKTEENNE